MSRRNTQLKNEQVDMESFFDFNQGTTPVTATSSKMDNIWSPYDQGEERQQFNGPSHDYNQYKQQVGLPLGSVANVPAQSMIDNYNTGMGDMAFDASWSTGIDMDADITMDFNNVEPAMFFPNGAQPDNFINPTNLSGDEPVSNVGRLWPGMHSQQAAMQKAAQATNVAQPRQMKPQFQQQHHRQASVSAQPAASASASASNGKRTSHATDPQVEERISRLLNQMRQNSTSANDDDSTSQSDMLPHVARMKKDDEEMDEDERLLASDEGKKLSSKERRQLRNKVSARAFRSRRKEYITQLEGEVAIKAQENVTLRHENDSLVQENERYRGFIETILRHPAFGPFMNDLSKDPSLLGLPQHPAAAQQQPQQMQPTPQQQQATPQPQQQQHRQADDKPAFLNFDASQLQVPSQSAQQTERINLATIPENDFSKLNINGFQNFNDFRSVNAFAVTSLPTPELSTLLVDATADSYFSAVESESIHAPVAQSGASLDLLLAKLDRAASRSRV